MNDPATLSDVHGAMDLSMDSERADLEQRVRRLEEEVGALHDTRALEDRITQRVTERVQQAVSTAQFTAQAPTRGPAPRDVAIDGLRTDVPRSGHIWLFAAMLADARLLVRMFRDKRYHMAWTTHLVVWLFIPAILTSGWWFPFSWIPFVGFVVEKTLDLVLAFCVYKALSRELRRYRELAVY